MLVFSRKRNEVIMINDDIRIVVVAIRGDKVRLGIEAPSDVQVHRKEVYDAIKQHESNRERGTIDVQVHVADAQNDVSA